MRLRVHARMDISEVNGPGRRAVLWLQGCSLGCAGCWNPSSHTRSGGQEIDDAALVQWVHGLWDAQLVSGLTLSGGEPLEQPTGVAALLEVLRREIPPLSIGVFSGYSRAELDRGRFHVRSNLPKERLRDLWIRIQGCLDWAVLGRYNRLQPASDPLVSSRNQRLELYSARHSSAEFSPQMAEVTIDEQGVTQITGFPVLG